MHLILIEKVILQAFDLPVPLFLDKISEENVSLVALSMLHGFEKPVPSTYADNVLLDSTSTTLIDCFQIEMLVGSDRSCTLSIRNLLWL